MTNCGACGAELTNENWQASQKKRGIKRCRDCQVKRLEQWKKEHPKKASNAVKSWKQHHRDRVNELNAKSRNKSKLELLVHYSGTNPPQCANLFREHKEPYTTFEALSIDHINSGGADQRRIVGAHLQWWLKHKGYPEGYRVLCMNCQFIKRHRNKEWANKTVIVHGKHKRGS